MNNKKGFTLIEILIVVAIIAILASVVLVGLGPTQQSGRDARRLSDLQQIQNGLALYYNKCGYYPGTYTGAVPCTAFVASTGYASGANPVKTVVAAAGIGINTMPDDPQGAAHYLYATTATCNSFIIKATLENGNNAVFNSYTAPATAAYTQGDTVGACTAPNYCLTL